jgi:hypothetical protein
MAIWRYMDLPRFISMLAAHKLWFAKAATFQDDPYEGFCKTVRVETQPATNGPRSLHDDALDMYTSISQLTADVFENARKHLYVNSWCSGPEDMAMWQIYGSGGFGVAVESSIGRYRDAVKFAPLLSSQYDLRKVVYHTNIESAKEIVQDLRSSFSPPGPGLWPKVLRLAFNKRRCYKYEREWRAALCQDKRCTTLGVDVYCDLERLIHTVHVGPRAPKFFFEVVKSVMERFELRKPLRHSTLLAPPKRANAVLAG